MYEDKTRRKIQIDWKSLLIKLGILLVIVFIVLWIISLFKKDDKVTSNFGINLQSMRNAANEYFTGSKLPKEINESVSLTLGEMFERNLLIEFQDENGNACDTRNSYIEATKLDDENYRIEVKLVCDNNSDTIINTIQYQAQNEEEIEDSEQPVLNDESNEEDSNLTDSQNNESNNQSLNNTVSNSKPNNTTSNQTTKPNTSGTNNNTSSNNQSNNSTNNSTIATGCTYGKKEYVTVYPLAYVVSGNCAVSATSISGTHANNATRIGNKEYQKLVLEAKELENKTGTQLVVGNPEYTKIQNTSRNGYVGYQIYFTVKQKISTYSAKTIYAYYLDQNGNRKVIIDSRNSLSNSNSSNIAVTKVEINQSSLSLDVGDTYTLKATVSPSNATNKSVSWASSNNNVATVSSSGKVTAKRAGTAIITASIGSKKDTLTVKVNDNGYIEFNKSSVTLDKGDTYQLKYDTNLSGSIIWSTTNRNVATVSSNGKITAKGKGTATITATINGKKDAIKVTVKEDGYLKILDDDYLVIFVGNSYTLNVDTNIDNLSFISSNPTIATVDSKGNIYVKRVGNVTITAFSGNIEDSIHIYCQELSYFN